MGAMGAIMVLVMMLEIPPFEYHFNLSVITGIILGPQLAVLTALVVNIILALIGHGGVTVVGLNALVLSAELIMGYFVFRVLTRLKLSVWASSFTATLVGLVSGTAIAYGIIALGSPWVDQVLRSAALRPGMELGPGISGAHLDLARLALIMFGIGAIGWVAEALLSATIIAYLARLVPGLIKAGD
jgi:cobalt/nickel transport system permease protein